MSDRTEGRSLAGTVASAGRRAAGSALWLGGSALSAAGLAGRLAGSGVGRPVQNAGLALAASGSSRYELFGEVIERPDLLWRRNAIREKGDIGGPTEAPLNGAGDVLDEVRNGTAEGPGRAVVGVGLSAAGEAMERVGRVGDEVRNVGARLGQHGKRTALSGHWGGDSRPNPRYGREARAATRRATDVVRTGTAASERDRQSNVHSVRSDDRAEDDERAAATGALGAAAAAHTAVVAHEDRDGTESRRSPTDEGETAGDEFENGL